jgi:site-specific DNA recombinase
VNGKKIYRCAIYTRKSSEEGLDQDFNSLEAQREACATYVHSQAHEGWRLVPELLDDGGYSGGNTDRPALKRLMELVRAGEIDVIVIYKIDRLTRSLTDFARMAESFDKHDVSFVSVTQQLNTTTSMGRLMLNVLLSLRAVREGDHRGADPRQDCSLEAQGYVDGWQPAHGIRRARSSAGGQRS